MKKIYPFLLASLLGTLIASPISSAVGRSGEVIEICLMFCLTLSAFGGAVRHRKWLLLILVSAVLLKASGILLSIKITDTAGTLIATLLAGLAAYRAFRYALGSEEVDTDHICAALSVYMLAGFFFGITYWTMDKHLPGSFTLPASSRETSHLDLQTAVYFSFITIATVGYGDITPVSPVARGLVIAQAVLGQFYMVVLVARLVSVYSQKRSASQG